jgi:hypothetical protein
VTVTPNPVNVPAGSTVQFTATVTGTTNTTVAWQVNGMSGGNSTVGTISSAGLYTAPASPPSPATVAITAVSQADTTKSGSASATIVTMGAFSGTFTWRNDNARTGQNRQELLLTPATVNPAKFGKVFSFPVDGEVYAQPLYVPNVSVPGQGTRNVLYVATEHDTVYAFDADGRTTSPLWARSLIPAGGTTVPLPSPDLDCADIIHPEIGITGTPVIDPQTNTLYVVGMSKESSNVVQRLHALDIATGAEKFGGPKVIQASVRGIGAGGDGQGNIPFDSLHQNQRAALLLSGGRVYIVWASFCDIDPYHGWVLGYAAANLQQVAVFNTTPNGTEGGIWQTGAGPSADSSGNIYVITGNGTFDQNIGGVDFGDSFLKLNANLTSVLDFFTPFNQALLSETDLDVGSGGAVVLPDQPGTAHPHLILGGGKEGKLYVVDRDNLGHFRPTDDSQIVQSFSVSSDGFFSTPAFWENNVYIAGNGDFLKAFRLSGGLLSTTPTSQSSVFFDYPDATPAISSNGSTNGIVWALQTNGFATFEPSILRAYDATDLSVELYNSTSARDQAGPAVKFAVPTVANGRVYVGTGNEVTVYGLLP